MDWMKREITRGLQKLVFLALDRTPAMDALPGTVAAWMEALMTNRIWDEQRDADRIRAAFRSLGATRKSWPAPSDLIEHMPPAKQYPALPAKPVDPQVAEANIAKIKRMLRGQE